MMMSAALRPLWEKEESVEVEAGPAFAFRYPCPAAGIAGRHDLGSDAGSAGRLHTN
jgi:hypothetical protein